MAKKRTPETAPQGVACYATPTMVPTSELRPNEWNPNHMDDWMFCSLKAGIEKDGFLGAILALPDNTIIDGEHRWRAATELGLVELPVIHISVPEATAKRLTVALNKKRGELDYAKLSTLLGELDIDRDLALADEALAMGFTEGELARVLDLASLDASFGPGGDPVTPLEPLPETPTPVPLPAAAPTQEPTAISEQPPTGLAFSVVLLFPSRKAANAAVAAMGFEGQTMPKGAATLSLDCSQWQLPE